VLIAWGGSGQLGSYGGPPKSFFSLGVEQFNRNLDAMRGEYKDEEPQGKFFRCSSFLVKICIGIPIPCFYQLGCCLFWYSVETRSKVCTENVEAAYFEHNCNMGKREETSIANSTTAVNNSNPI
jgi:hypothetical protein